MEKTLTPKTANTMNKLCKLKRDNYSVRGSWICIGTNQIVINNQFGGKESTGKVILPKKVFERLIKFYETGI